VVISLKRKIRFTIRALLLLAALAAIPCWWVGRELNEYLNELYFQLTRLTDTSIPKFRVFDRLKFINLQQTAATSAAVKRLEEELPNTKIAFFHD
jgi:hypothetical protein